jgi:metallophosphoesterase superfamily enzyme
MIKKYDFLKYDIVKHFGKIESSTKIARLVSPTSSNAEIEKLRKHIDYLKSKEIETLDLEPYTKGNIENVLIIGDLHAPFNLENYLYFCRLQQEKFNCGRVVFIGDLIDNHYSSYHETDPDGMSAGDELDFAINEIQKYYKVFPEADVIIGNHDRLVYRKAFTSGVSKRWIKEYKEVLGTPNWNFVENLEIFDVNINHGEGGTARTKMKKELQSQIQGHLHSDLYVEYIVGKNFRIFGMQVGCGVNFKSYAMEYGKNFKKPAIGCGVLLNKGTLPIPIPMLL